jgi:hypothetical protein
VILPFRFIEIFHNILPFTIEKFSKTKAIFLIDER